MQPYSAQSCPETRIYDLLNEALEQRADLTRQIDELSIRRDQIRQQIGQYRERLSPIRKISSDILRHIFEWCLPAMNTLTDHSVAPLLLMQVCGLWREVALSTPSLWTSFDITFLHRPDLTSPRGLRSGFIPTTRIDQWIRRSGALPLTISINICSSLQNDANLHAVHLYASIVQCSKRWQNITLRVPRSWLQCWISLSAADVPMLKTFSQWDVTNPPQPDDTHNLWNSLQILATETLREVDLRMIQAEGFHVTQPPDLRFADNLSYVCLDSPYITVSNVWNILSRFPHLEKCDFSIYGRGGTSSWIESATLTLPRLTSFKLQVNTRYSLLNFFFLFSKLLLPKITNFEYRGNSPPSAVWDAARHCLNVPKLSLEFRHLLDPNLRKYLLGNLHIQNLKIFEISMNHELLRDLLLIPDTTNTELILCPYLRTLELNDLYMALSVSLIEMLKEHHGSTKYGRPRFQELCLRFSRSLPSHIMEEFETLRSTSNLRIAVSSVPTPGVSNTYGDCTITNVVTKGIARTMQSGLSLYVQV